MAFICPKQDDILKKQATLNAIADIALELKKEFENVYCEAASPPPMCCCCPPVNCPPPLSTQKPQEAPCEPPNVMVCYKVGKTKTANTNSNKTARKNQNRSADGQNVIRLKQSKSRELRAGVMYVGCDCEKRNGLQDDCQRTECHGSPECLTTPYPVCGPSEFSNGGSYGAAATTNSGAVGNTQQADIGNDYLEYEYQCFPAVEKSDDADALCPCCNCEISKEPSLMSTSTEYRDNYCYPEEEEEEDDLWQYEVVPACIGNITQLDECRCECRCECQCAAPTGRATYWCKMCNRSLPFGYH